MVKLCDNSLVKPLSVIFQKCIKSDVFLDSWKKIRHCPNSQKNDKQLINNYRPVSPLPICSKIFKIIISNLIFQFIEENKLLNVCPDFNQVILVSISYCQLFPIYMLVLTKTLHLRCLHVSLTSQRLLIRFGMKSLFIR